MVTLGTKLRAIRAVLDMGQTEFATFAGVNQPELSKVEREQTVPYGKFVERIETALGVSLNDPRIENAIVALTDTLPVKQDLSVAA